MVKALRRYGFESRSASAEMSRPSSSPPSSIASGEYRPDSTLERHPRVEVAGSTPARPSGRVAQSLVRSSLIAARAVLLVEHVFGRMPTGLHAPKRSRVRFPPAPRRSSSVVEHSAPSRHSLVARRARHASPRERHRSPSTPPGECRWDSMPTEPKVAGSNPAIPTHRDVAQRTERRWSRHPLVALRGARSPSALANAGETPSI